MAPMKKPRITLIHATPVAIDPICASFRRLWPQAQVANLLEDSLSADLAAAGQLDHAIRIGETTMKQLAGNCTFGIAAVLAAEQDCGSRDEYPET